LRLMLLMPDLKTSFPSSITSTIRSITCSETNERKTKKKLNCY